MGFRRPLVQVQSLGPKSTIHRKVGRVFCPDLLNLRPPWHPRAVPAKPGASGAIQSRPAMPPPARHGRWFKSSHSDQLKKTAKPLISTACGLYFFTNPCLLSSSKHAKNALKTPSNGTPNTLYQRLSENKMGHLPPARSPRRGPLPLRRSPAPRTPAPRLPTRRRWRTSSPRPLSSRTSR